MVDTDYISVCSWNFLTNYSLFLIKIPVKNNAKYVLAFCFSVFPTTASMYNTNFTYIHTPKKWLLYIDIKHFAE